MKILKSSLAALLAVLMVASMAGCLHAKNESVITVGGEKFTSGQYLYALINADMAARQKVNEQQGDNAQSTAIDYYSQKINKKNFVDYVQDEAVKTLKQYAAIIKKCKENNIKLDKDGKKELDQVVEQQWTSYGYSTVFEPNGVSKETFAKCYEYDYLTNKYFESIYGKKGTKAVKEEDANAALLENFVLADVLTCDLSQMETDAEKQENEAKFTGYVERLNKGESFYTVYNEYNNSSVAETTDIETDKDGIPTQPADPLANVIGSADSAYASDYYDTAKAMKAGEAKLYKAEDGSSIAVIFKKDLAADKYFMNSLYSPALYILKEDEFNKDLNTYKKTLKVKKLSGIKRLKVKNIDYGNGQ